MTSIAPKKRLGELLVESGIIDETQLKAALAHQRQWGVRLGHAVVDLKFATEQEVVKVLAKRFGFEVARLDQVEAYAHQQAISLVPRDFAVRYNAFPLAADTSTLSVAMSDPSNLAVVDELRFRSGRRVKVSIGGDQEISAAIQAAYPSPDGAIEAIALDIDEGSPDGESVMGAFGGGSSADFDSFFGADPAQHPFAQGTDLDDPFSSGPAPAPVSVGPTQPAPAATSAPFPSPFPSPFPATAAQPAPAAAVAPAPTAPAPASTPAPTPAAARAPVAAPPQPAPVRAPSGPAPRPAAAATPSARPAPAAPAAPLPSAPVAPGGPAARPATRPGVPMIGDLELELPSREQRAGPVPAAPAPQPAPAAPARAARSAPAPVASAPAPAPAAARVGGPQVAAPAAAPPEPVAPLLMDIDEEEPIIGELTGELELPAPGGATTPSAPGFSRAEQAVLDALERLADGGRAEPEILKPTQAIAVLVRLLLRKGVISERELLDALRTRDPD